MIRRYTQIKRGKPPKKKTSDQRLMEELDGLLKEILILQRGEFCERCGSNFRLQGAHILPKGTYKRLRFMHLNLLILCFPCHPEWWHRNPVESIAWLQEKFPGRIEQLYLWARQMPAIDLKEIRISLQMELKLLGARGGKAIEI